MLPYSTRAAVVASLPLVAWVHVLTILADVHGCAAANKENREWQLVIILWRDMRTHITSILAIVCRPERFYNALYAPLFIIYTMINICFAFFSDADGECIVCGFACEQVELWQK